MARTDWLQVEPGMVNYTGPDFNATLYRSRDHHPDGELPRRPTQLPSRDGWSAVGDLPRSPIRGIRNFTSLEEAEAAVERTFETYRTTMNETGMTAQDIKNGLRAHREAEDRKYRRQVSMERAQRPQGRYPTRGVTNLALKVGS